MSVGKKNNEPVMSQTLTQSAEDRRSAKKMWHQDTVETLCIVFLLHAYFDGCTFQCGLPRFTCQMENLPGFCSLWTPHKHHIWPILLFLLRIWIFCHHFRELGIGGINNFETTLTNNKNYYIVQILTELYKTFHWTRSWKEVTSK